MNITQNIRENFLNRLTATPAGRAHMLNMAAEAEDSDEGVFFEQIFSQVDDPQLQKMVRKHEEDEKRHAALFRSAVKAQGHTPGPVQPELHLMEHLDTELGGMLHRDITTRRHVMEAYAVLQVVEERALEQFSLLEPIFRKSDPATADIIAGIAKDEDRHLKYCIAIARRYADSEQDRLETVQRYRRAEAIAYARYTQAAVTYAFKEGLVKAGRLERLAWKGMLAMSLKSGGEKTRFWDRDTEDALCACDNNGGWAESVLRTSPHAPATY